MTTYMSMVPGALPMFLRALAFLGWCMYRTSTLRQPRHPSSIVRRLPGRLQSARHSPLPRSFGLARCSDMRISSSPICQVFLSSSSLPSSHLPDPWLYNQHGPSGGTSITLRPRPALYMCASIASLSSAFYLNPRPRLKVMDVAQALSNLIRMPATDRTLALPGPSTLTYEYLLELVSTLTYNPPSRAPVVPKRVALALARAAQRIWWPLLSPDEVERRYIDDADTPGDWAFVGVEPDEIENHAITYVRRYRSAYVAIPSLWPLSAPYFFASLLPYSYLPHPVIARTISAPSLCLHDR